MSGRRLYLIAGEPSGDRLGAALMSALREQEPDITFMGIGGLEMQAAGLEPLFDVRELAVMGIAEVLPRLRGILRRLKQATGDVVSQRPDALITIDSPSFSLRVAARARRALPGLKTIHYVAPSVWAWRPGRAKHMARFIDHVLALLPFEPPYMEVEGMSCDFVGHPIASREPVSAEETAELRASLGIGRQAPVLLMAPGSRRSEVARLLPCFVEVAARLRAEMPDLQIIVPIAETVIEEVRAGCRVLDPRPAFLMPTAEARTKQTAFAAADAALVASGTITLEMAAAGTPMVAGYKASPLTAAILRRLIRVDSGNLVNLVEGGRSVPELYQEALSPGAAYAALAPLFRQGEARQAQLDAFVKVMSALGRGGEAPATRAAKSVLSALSNPRAG